MTLFNLFLIGRLMNPLVFGLSLLGGYFVPRLWAVAIVAFIVTSIQIVWAAGEGAFMSMPLVQTTAMLCASIFWTAIGMGIRRLIISRSRNAGVSE